MLNQNIQVIEEHKNIHKLLSENNIPYVFLKGCASARYYPDPLLRGMGDVDFYVPPEQLDKARGVFEEDGFELVRRFGVLATPECHTMLAHQGIRIEKINKSEVGVIKGTAPFLVTGNKLSLTQTDEGAAIIADDDSVLANVTYVTEGSKPPIFLKCQVASSLANGTYRLRIRTRGYNNPSGQLITLIKKVDVKAS